MATSDSNSSSIPLDKAATELGVPVVALRLHLQSAHGGTSSGQVSQKQMESLQTEIKNRLGNLRLDDLARTTLTIEWLAESATHQQDALAKLTKAVEEEKQSALATPDPELVARLEKLEVRDASGEAMKLVASLQTMVENQGKQMDQLMGQLAELKREAQSAQMTARQAESALDSLVSRLQGALGGSNSAVPDPKVPVAEAATTSSSEATATINQSPTGYKNAVATVPAKFGVKREVEYNFLMERMGFKRLDAYASAELESEENVPVPGDDEIKEFLAKYELACDPVEVDIVSVHRGDYQMIQYQRTERPSGGLKGWMPARRKG